VDGRTYVRTHGWTFETGCQRVDVIITVITMMMMTPAAATKTTLQITLSHARMAVSTCVYVYEICTPYSMNNAITVAVVH